MCIVPSAIPQPTTPDQQPPVNHPRPTTPDQPLITMSTSMYKRLPKLVTRSQTFSIFLNGDTTPFAC